MVSETLAKKVWNGRNPIGQRLRPNLSARRDRSDKITLLNTLHPDLGRLVASFGRAHRQQTNAHLRRELKMAVPLHRLDQNGHQRPQPLAADPV